MVRHKELHLDPEDGLLSGSSNHPNWVFPEKIRFKMFKVKSVELPLTFFRSIPYEVRSDYNSTLPLIYRGWAHFSSSNGVQIDVVSSTLKQANFYTVNDVIKFFSIGGVSPINTSLLSKQCIKILWDRQQGTGTLTLIWSVPSAEATDFYFTVKDPHAAEVLGFKAGNAYATTISSNLDSDFPNQGLPSTRGIYLTAPFPCQPHGMNYVYLRSNSMALGCQYGIHNTPYGQAISNTILAKIPLPSLNYVGERICWTNHESQYLNFPGHQIDSLDLCFTSENLRDVHIDTLVYNNPIVYPQNKLLWKAGYSKYQEIDMRNGKWSVTFLLAECMCPDIAAAYNVCNGI